MNLPNAILVSCGAAIFAFGAGTAGAADGADADGDPSDFLLLSDEVVPWQELGEDFPDRPKPITEVLEDALFPQNRERNKIIELSHISGDATLLDEAPERRNLFGGNPFLGTGPLYEGFEIPTGAVWQPVFIAYGEIRSAVQAFDNGFGNTTEWVNRLDLFGNLYLTPTERILIGFRPLDREGDFTGYQFSGDDEGGFETFNGEVRSLFFEGDFGELFPNLDPGDQKNFDYGFSLGRQPINFQDGILLNDSIDSIGVTRASLFTFGANAARITALAGFNEIHRGDNVRDPDAFIYGIFSSLDYDKTTVDIDFAYVDGDPLTGGDGLYAGIGDTRRIGEWNSTLRLNGSWALEDGSTAVGDGAVLTSQISRTVTYNDDIFYIDGFAGAGDYTSAARDPAVGGPLGTIGILYASQGLGDFGTPLGNRVGDSIGFATGYQHFFDSRKASLIAEVGGRASTGGEGEDSIGFALRFQRAMSQHSILQLDGFVAGYDDGNAPERGDVGVGLRAEWRVKF